MLIHLTSLSEEHVSLAIIARRRQSCSTLLALGCCRLPLGKEGRKLGLSLKSLRGIACIETSKFLENFFLGRYQHKNGQISNNQMINAYVLFMKRPYPAGNQLKIPIVDP